MPETSAFLTAILFLVVVFMLFRYGVRRSS
jgi:hypothetical protein